MVGRQYKMVTTLSPLRSKIISRGFFLASAILLATSANSAALAECGHGHSPSYSDVESIYVERLQAGGPNFKAIVTRPGDVLFIGRKSVPNVGMYDGADGSPLFDELLAIIEKREFYSMQLNQYDPAKPSKPLPEGTIARIITDGPDDHVAVLRCGVVTKIETYGGSDSVFLANDVDDPQTKSFVDFVDDLQGPILAWPWQKERRVSHPAPAASTQP
jgi:hypothetical protein